MKQLCFKKSFDYAKHHFKKPYTNLDLEEKMKKIKNFRGVFMRDSLPKKVKNKECGIVNLDSEINKGTHWVCYYVNGKTAYYFDSFGLLPPNELQEYLKNKIILINNFKVQDFNADYCGHLCVYVLKSLNSGGKFEEITFELFDTYKYFSEHNY